MVSIDNIIQSPIVSGGLSTILIDDVSTTDELIDLDDVTSLFGGDLIKIGNEIVLIESIGVEIPNRLRVRRS